MYLLTNFARLILNLALLLICLPWDLAAADQQQLFEGPNCLNTVLLTKGVVSEKIYSSNDLFLTYLNSDNCRELNPVEKTKAGDIGIILNKNFLQNNFVSHAFTYLNPTSIFEKEGLSPSSPYQSRHVNKTLNDYDIAPGLCTQKFDPKNCLNSLTRYRCSAYSHKTDELNLEVAQYERQIAQLVWSKDTVLDLNLANRNLQHLEIKIRSSRPFEANILLERINSIRLQIGILRN